MTIERRKADDLREVVTREYSPEKAGVGGSTPSLATILIAFVFNHRNRLCNFVLFLAKDWKADMRDSGRIRLLFA
jgi:hypothetical protein